MEEVGASTHVKLLRIKSTPDAFKTNEVCDLFDISKATLFRWERKGMISGPPRDWRNWRLYTKENVAEIKKVIRARRVLV